MLNKVTLIGNLGGDPDVRFMPNGNPAATLSIATTRSWKDKQSGEKKEDTEWHRVIFFNRLAEIARDYLRKGAKVYIEGRLQTRKWQKDGVDHYTTEIIGEQIRMLGSRQEGQQSGPAGAGNLGAGSKYDPPHYQAPPEPAFDNFDDYIPF